VQGQRKEQHALFQYMAPLLMKVCLRYATSNDIAKDYLQEALIKIFNKIADYRKDGPFEAWARKVTVTTIIDNIRKQNDLDKSLSLEDIREKHHDIIQNRGSEELDYADIVQFINRLPEAKRVVFNLYAIEGYTHKEIAEQLQISEGTSKSQLHKAREMLMQMHLEYNKQITRTDEDFARTY